MSLTLQVHTYEDDQASGERRLVAYHPFMLVGRPLDSGHAGERLYLQAGCVYGEGGHVVPPAAYPAWLVEVLAALNPDELRKVGFVPEGVEEAGWSPQAMDPSSPVVPPGFKPDRSILGWLCKHGHDYAGTGQSRYDKAMRCVDCTNGRRAAHKRKQKESSRGTP